MARAVWLVLGAFVVAHCVAPPAPRRSTVSTSHDRAVHDGPPVIVLLAIDGVRWQEVFGGVDPELAGRHGLARSELARAEGLMPNLHALAAGGGALLGGPGTGSSVRASGPELLSLPGYAEILTGRRWSGCKSNACVSTSTLTIADEIAGEAGRVPEDVAVVTSWPDIGRIASRHPDRLAMSTGRHGGPTRALFLRDALNAALVENAADASPRPGQGDFRPDRYTARIALRYLETERPRFLFIALGEPDEYAHQGDYRGYLRALRYADLVIGELALALGEQARKGSRTLLFVTSDHGRAADFVNHGRRHPESARVFLLAWGTEIEPLHAIRGDRRLSDLVPTLRLVLGLPADRHAAAGEPIAELLKGPS